MSENYVTQEKFDEAMKRIDKNFSELRNELQETRNEFRHEIKQTRKDFAKIIAEMKEENRQRQILLEKENIKRDANINKIESVFTISIAALDKKCDWITTALALIFGALGFFIALVGLFR